MQQLAISRWQMAQSKTESSIDLGGVPHEEPATPDPTLIQLIASNAVLVEEHMQLALPFSFTI
jgi:hypothetical protein